MSAGNGLPHPHGSAPIDTVPIRVAYTVEQCWHAVPGGTAVAALEIGRELSARPDDVELHLVAGRHPRPPAAAYRPSAPVAMLPLARPWLYETWTRLNWPKVEAVIGEIDVAHATGLVPCATSAPLVVTVHDVAFLHDPDKFSRHGVNVMRRSIDVIDRRADRVICPSSATVDDLVALGFDRSRLRLVPLGVRPCAVGDGERRRVRRQFALADEFVLFVGTLEPRKNLARLVEAMRLRAVRQPLVVVGADGWGDLGDLGDVGDVGDTARDLDVRFLGFVDQRDLIALYAAAAVFAYPSEREGYGLPVAEAMAAGTPVVTSRGTSTEEVAGGAAVLVDPFDPVDIARGVDEALDRADELAAAGAARADALGWDVAAQRTIDVYRELVS